MRSGTMGLIWPPTQRRPLIYIKRPGPRVCRGRDHASAQMFCQLYGKARDIARSSLDQDCLARLQF
jgi:hypothetical protein